MSSIVILVLFIGGCVLLTALLAAGGSGWRAGIQAAKGFGGWIGGLLLLALAVWAFMPAP